MFSFFKIYIDYPDELDEELKLEYSKLEETKFIYWGSSDDLLQQRLEVLKKHPSISISEEIKLTKHIQIDKNANFIYFITNLSDIRALFKDRDKKDIQYADSLLSFPFVTELNGKNNELILELMARQQFSIISLQIENKIEFVQDVINSNAYKIQRFVELLENYMKYLGKYLEIENYDIFKSNYERVGINIDRKNIKKYDIYFDPVQHDARSFFSTLHNLFIFLEINIVEEITIIHYCITKMGERQ